MRLTVVTAALLFVASPAARAQLPIDPAKVVDLTYAFDERAIYWPTAKPFTWEKESWGLNAEGKWYTAARYSASEHGGTHLDAPIHFAEGTRAADEIPVADLIGPAVVIDISKAAAANPDATLTAADLQAWEKQHGAITAGTIVLVHSGWGSRWGDKKRYLGTDKAGDTQNLHFPGIARGAAEMLVQRKVKAVGIDTPSLDHGPSRDFIAHRVLLAANIYGLENVAELGRLPPRGATVIALPMKIRGGTGGPARIIAVLP